MSVPFTFKMREPLAARLAKVADVTGLRPDDLVRFAVSALVTTIEANGSLSLSDSPLGDIPQDGVPVFLPPEVAAPIITAAKATRFEGGVNGVVQYLVETAAEWFSKGDYSLIVDDSDWACVAREGEEVKP